MEMENLSNNQKETIETVRKKLLSPLASEIEKMSSKIESLNERLPSKIKEVESLEGFLESHDKVIVDFSSEWCIPCYRYLGPLERIAQEGNGVIVGKVDVEENEKAAERANKIQDREKGLALPFLVSFRNGEVVQKVTGALKGDKAYDVARWMALRLEVSNEEFENKMEWAKTVANEKGWKLNPNKGMRDGLIAALVVDQHCPCKGEEVKENICPCDPYKDYPGAEKMIEKEGRCYCGLFVSEEYNR